VTHRTDSEPKSQKRTEREEKRKEKGSSLLFEKTMP
jgi:hypothetical protein